MELNTVFGQLIRHGAADVLDEAETHTVLALDLVPHLHVTDGIQVLHTQIFQLLLDFLHTETVGQGCVDLHGLQGGNTALVIGLGIQGTHVVEAVAELDKDHADVLGHGQEHLPQCLDVSLLLVVDLKRHDLGQTLHQHGNVGPESLSDLLTVRFLAAVLHGIVQQSGADGVGIQLQAGHDLGYGDGVGDVGLTAVAELALVEVRGIIIGGLDLIQVVLFARRLQDFQKSVDTDVGCLFHSVSFRGGVLLRRVGYMCLRLSRRQLSA